MIIVNIVNILIFVERQVIFSRFTIHKKYDILILISRLYNQINILESDDMLREIFLHKRLLTYYKKINRSNVKLSDKRIECYFKKMEKTSNICTEYINNNAQKLQNFCNLYEYIYTSNNILANLLIPFAKIGVDHYLQVLLLLGKIEFTLKNISIRLNQFKYLL